MSPLADKIISLSPELLAELKGLIVESRNTILTRRPIIDLGDLHQASDTYVAKVPVGGIPATDLDGVLGTSTATGVVVGHADCDIYHLYDDGTAATLLRVNRTERVYNLSTTEVEADSYVLIVKTKSGPWFVTGGSTGGGGGTSTASCELASLKTTDCLQASVGAGAVLMEGSGSGEWVSNTDLDYGYGTGEARFWFDGGTPHLSLSGLELMYCGNSCWAGGELTGHITGTSTVAATAECEGASFTVCLECHTCTLPPVSVACCTGPMAQVLNAQIALHGGGGVGSCGCLAPPLNLTLTWSSGTGDWRYSGDICGTDSVFRFYCDPGIMKIEGVSGCTFPPVNPYNGPDADCNPVLFQYEIPIADFSCCTPTIIGVQVTITE